ncbi:MAG: DUF3810 domain-containing protein, partial [Clostridia bacterium]|nr:DUF3810 domain-containing protein [Clostridia bacterium]
FFRALNAHLTGWIPFSLAEFLLISSPILIVCAVVLTTRRAMRGRRYFIRCVTGILSVVVLIASMFVFTFGAGYRVPMIDRKLGITREKVSAEELAATMEIVIERLNELAPYVTYMEEKGSVRPYTHEETVQLCLDSYAKLSEQHPFIQKLNTPVKQIMLSDYMTYTHISGMYTFFTGEANLNTNYPYFVNVYTTAHEMAHQRGIARENEANFLAYLVCIGSDDPYMQYSGYLNMYEYLASPLYSASPSLYSKTIERLDQRVRYDLHCYSEFFDKYRDNAAAEVSDAVNNTYLVLQGTEGSKSYGMVVDLAVAYHLREQP